MYDPPEVLDFVLDFLTDAEEKQLEAIMTEINDRDEDNPGWKDPRFDSWWNEHMELLHQLGVLTKLAEERAKAKAATDPETFSRLYPFNGQARKGETNVGSES